MSDGITGSVGDVLGEDVDVVRDVRMWPDDDLAARAFLEQRTLRGWRAQRVLGWVTVLALVAGAAIIGLAAVGEQRAAGGSLDDSTNARVGAGVLIAAVVAGVAYIGLCFATRRYLRSVQQAALDWLELRDPDQAGRGLPPVLRLPFDDHPSHRLMTLAWLLPAMLALILLIAGPAMATIDADGSPPVAVGVAVTVVGLACGVVTVVVGLRVARAQAAQRERAAELAGRRLFLEEIILREAALGNLGPGSAGGSGGPDEPGP